MSRDLRKHDSIITTKIPNKFFLHGIPRKSETSFHGSPQDFKHILSEFTGVLAPQKKTD